MASVFNAQPISIRVYKINRYSLGWSAKGVGGRRQEGRFIKQNK
jgi:hypothetical protein